MLPFDARTLLAEAARLDKEAWALLREKNDEDGAVLLGREAKRLRLVARKLMQAEGVEPTALTLKAGTEAGTVKDDMYLPEPTQGSKAAASLTEHMWPWRIALIRNNLSVPQWVLGKGKRGPGKEAARSWLKQKGKGGRPVPREWADRLAEEFDMPELSHPSSWPCGIRED